MKKIEAEFRTPPAPSRRPYQVKDFVDKLIERPGEWAAYCTGNGARTAFSKAQQYKKRYPGTEWIVRREESGYTVFGRWMA